MYRAGHIYAGTIILLIFVTYFLIDVVGFIDLAGYTFVMGLIIYGIILSYVVINFYTVKVLSSDDYLFSLVGGLVFLIPIVNISIFFITAIILIIDIEDIEE